MPERLINDYLELRHSQCSMYIFVQEQKFMDYLPEEELKLVTKPYFFCHQKICYIWPASVPRGKVKMSGV